MDRRTFLATGAAAGAGVLRPSLPYSRSRPFGLATPSPAQLAWQQVELGLFVHFTVNTFTDREWGDGTESPSMFNPTALDARQWARAAKAGGFRRMTLTAKHHDGFCLWPSALTDHSVKSSPWRGGQGDVVREFVDACRAEQLGVGLYLSPWDRHEPRYGDSPRYNDYYCGQLTELLRNYGPIVEVWFDGANGEGPNGRTQVYDWDRYHRIIRRLQPGALIFSDAGPDIRWIGNENGVAGDPNWCAVDPAVVPYPGASGDAVTAELQHGDPRGTVWRPGESDVSIRPGWFWHAHEDAQVRSAENLLELYFSSVGRNTALLLNVPPTREGLFHPTDVQRLATFGARRTALFADDLARSATRKGNELWFSAPVTFDVAALAEDVSRGQLVERYLLETWNGSRWETTASGTTIGVRKLDRFAPVTTDRVRVSAFSSLGTPRLSAPALYQTPS
ncbi:MAG TPA: alpha-L-fucosidase [Gemmatimonadales bacterium]